MINISEEIIKQMLEKEIKEQVSKLLKSKKFEATFNNIIRDEIYNTYKVTEVAKEVYKDKDVRNRIINQVAELTYENIVETIKGNNYEEFDDDDY